MGKVRRKSAVSPSGGMVDTLNQYTPRDNTKAMDVLYKAQMSWDGLYAMRVKRDRLMRFTYGDQYCDRLDVDGQLMREDAYWASQGVIPKKNNVIRKMVRSVIGVYKNQGTDFTVIARDRAEQKIGEMFTITLQANREINRMGELEIRLFEEFIISATIFIKESYGYRRGRKDTWSDIVSPDNIFYDGVMQDVRHWDCSIIGQIHDMTFGDLCAKFAHAKADYDKLKQIYSNATDDRFVSSYYQNIYQNAGIRGSFYVPLDPNLCRVIEVWSKEQKSRYRCHDWATGEDFKVEESDLQTMVLMENDRRMQEGGMEGIPMDDIALIDYEWFVDDYWYFRFLTPLGDVLQEGETPFKHHEHPYTMKIHPFIDGKSHSLVEDSIDQQKFINELITLYMLMAKHSAKGLLMFPEQLIPDDMSMEDIADEWSKVNGMIVFKAKQDIPMPQQLSTNVQNFNVSELLKIEMGMFEEVTGITGAIQGKTPASGTAASLYAQQAQNASNTLVDILESFSNFLKEATVKKLTNIQQFYTEERNIMIAGAQYGGVKKYMPNLAQDVELDVSVTESASTPSYRAVMNDFLMRLWESGAIDTKQMLETGNFTFADELLQSIKIKEEEQAKMQQQQ